MDEQLLTRRIEQWQHHADAQPGVANDIAHCLVHLTDPGARLYPHALAAASDQPLARVLPELLRAVPVGLLDLHWDIRCPHCDNLGMDLQHLHDAVGVGHCRTCAADFEVDFAANVEVTFSLNGEIAPPQVPAARGCAASVPRLTGLDILHEPSFRLLFGDEVLSRREQLRIAAVTTLFTDVTGSTAMYERLGDPVAYNVVRDHFEILFAAIEQRGGTVIKTIGDAVMGSFVNNHDAVQSVLDAFEQFRRYNIDHLVERHVHIKAGIHRGPAILVNLDGRLDYFGSTINRAARLQGHARADQILLTQSVHADPDVQAALAAAGLSDPVESLVDMKGIDGRQTVYRWQYGPSPDTASGAHEGLVARLFRLWR